MCQPMAFLVCKVNRPKFLPPPRSAPFCGTWISALPNARYSDVPAIGQGGTPGQGDRFPDLSYGHRCEGQIADALHLENRVSKGHRGGRTIPLHSDLYKALMELYTECGDEAQPERPIIFSERGLGLSATTGQLWFHRLYTSLGFTGCSSHSGWRTFIIRAARKVSEVGGSLRDEQQLAGHASLRMPQEYIEDDSDAKRKLSIFIYSKMTS